MCKSGEPVKIGRENKILFFKWQKTPFQNGDKMLVF